MGLGNEKCNKKFYVTNREDSSSFLEPKNTYVETYKIKSFKKIKINKLENMINSDKLEKNVLVKLDVQGFELEVLKGAKKLLNKIDYIITEMSYQNIYKNQVVRSDLKLFLKKNNFVKVKNINITKFDKKLFQSDALFRKKLK